MLRFRSLAGAVFLVCTMAAGARADDSSQQSDWVHHARIAAYGLTPDNADQIVRQATDSDVNGIEVDNDISGRYESFLDPREKLEALRKLAQAAHKAGNHAFVYIAGTECITANADKTQRTLAKEHPDWLQRKITGEPAIFTGGAAFWIRQGDEDVWISPYAQPWRKTYMERVRQIAATGIDGIYVDIPYWMTHFTGWEDSWASFDDYTVAAFRERTGLDARKNLMLGDFSDANFRKWVDFRIQTLTDFMQEIDRNAKSVNPKIITVAEVYPGIEEEVVRVGADPYQMYAVLDTIAHEYEFGGGDHTASARAPLDWFKYQVGMAAFRSFAEGKPTWILNYSWDGDAKVDRKASMENLAMSQLMAGANFWDAKGHVMSGSNDLPTRKRIFFWTAQHSDVFYSPRKPIAPIGVYFSPATRNYFAEKFLASFRGVMILLMEKHLEYQVVTPRTLKTFAGKTLVLPDVRVLDDAEKAELKNFAGLGNRLVITGTDITGLAGSLDVIRIADDPGSAYMGRLEKDFAGTTPAAAQNFLDQLHAEPAVAVNAPPFIATHVASVEGKICVFLVNFSGLRSRETADQVPQSNVSISFPGTSPDILRVLPFLGEQVAVKREPSDNKTSLFLLPPIKKGAVACAGRF
jgi:hypothetical protein